MKNNSLERFLNILVEANESLDILIDLAKRLYSVKDCLVHGTFISEEQLYSQIPQRWYDYSEDEVRIGEEWATKFYITPAQITYERARFKTNKTEEVMTISITEEPIVRLKDLSFFSEFSVSNVKMLFKNVVEYFSSKVILLEKKGLWKLTVIINQLGCHTVDEYTYDSELEALERKKFYESNVRGVEYAQLEYVQDDEGVEGE